MAISVFASISSASKGSELLDIEEKAGQFETENRKLKTEIIGNTSLVKLSEEAGKLGMVRPLDVVYINESSAKNN